MKISIFYCVNKSGQGCVFTTYPTRDEKRLVWLGRAVLSVTRFIDYLETGLGYKLPDISWNDDPVKIDINITQQ